MIEQKVYQPEAVFADDSLFRKFEKKQVGGLVKSDWNWVMYEAALGYSKFSNSTNMVRP